MRAAANLRSALWRLPGAQQQRGDAVQADRRELSTRAQRVHNRGRDDHAAQAMLDRPQVARAGDILTI